MSNHEPMTPTGESSVSDEGHLVAEAAPHDRAGGTQHLAHARTTAWPFIADHDDIARLHFSRENRLRRTLFAIEHARGAREAQTFLARDLRNRAFGREVAGHHDEVTVLLDRVRERTNNVL